MLDIFTTGIRALQSYWLEVLGLLWSGLSFGAISALILFRRKNFDMRIVYVLLLGFVFLGVLSPILSLAHVLNTILIVLFLIIGGFAMVRLIRLGAFALWTRKDYQKNIWIPSLIFLLSLVMRFAYLDELIFPPFSDSAEHFNKVSLLLKLGYVKPLSLANFFPVYHWGFHGITAWIDTLSQNFDPITMAVVAHFFLALLPVAVYFMLLAFMEEDIYAAIFGALLAGFGWVMPAFSIHYGKYPALVAMSLLPLLLGVFNQSVRAERPQPRAWWIYIAIISMCLIWVHSRLVFVLTFFYLTYFLSNYIRLKMSEKAYDLSAFFLILVIVFLILFLNYSNPSKITFLYYLKLFRFATILVVILLPFALIKNTTLAYQWGLIIVLSIFAVTTSAPLWIYRYRVTLFDQFFFDLFFFMPLTVFGALGINGVLNLFPKMVFLKKTVFLSVILIVITNGIMIQPWEPVSNTNYVSDDDIQAFSWITETTPPDAVFIIAAKARSVHYLQPSDSGVWINILTGRDVIKKTFQIDWDSGGLSHDLCVQSAPKPVYIYVGHVDSSFNISACDMPQTYQEFIPVYCSHKAKVLALDCNAITQIKP